MDLTPTPDTEIRRLPQRGRYDRATIDSILDEGLVAHVGLVSGERPVVIPMVYGRDGDDLYLHGSPASRLLRTAKRGVDVAVTVTLIDGLVLARSPFHHSVNYRSVVVLGTAVEVKDLEERAAALYRITDHVAPGRSAHTRPHLDKEVRGTTVLKLPIDEASAKVRTGPPVDEEEDYDLDIWAGVLPLTVTPGAPEPDPRLPGDIPVPTHVSDWPAR